MDFFCLRPRKAFKGLKVFDFILVLFFLLFPFWLDNMIIFDHGFEIYVKNEPFSQLESWKGLETEKLRGMWRKQSFWSCFFFGFLFCWRFLVSNKARERSKQVQGTCWKCLHTIWYTPILRLTCLLVISGFLLDRSEPPFGHIWPISEEISVNFPGKSVAKLVRKRRENEKTTYTS